jgi:hypothetical protein
MKLRFLKTRLVGRAQRAFQHLSDTSRATYGESKAALRSRFEPGSKKSRYQSEFQCRRKKKGEPWPDFAEDLRELADKAYPELQVEARERLALNNYLNQLDQPQVRFGVNQKRPATLDEAVSATLEMESFLVGPGAKQPVASVDQEEPAVAGVSPSQDKLTSLVEKLIERVERLENTNAEQPTQKSKPKFKRRSPAPEHTGGSPRGNGRGPQGSCWTCKQRGYYSRDCPSKSAKDSNGHHSVMQINPVGGFKLRGKINGVPADFLVDTGAAVTLVRDDLWKQAGLSLQSLIPWGGCRLLGVDGSPLKIHGQAKTNLEFHERVFYRRCCS